MERGCLLVSFLIVFSLSFTRPPTTISLLLAQSVLSGACIYVIHVQLLIYLIITQARDLNNRNVARMMGINGILGLRWMVKGMREGSIEYDWEHR